VSAATLPQTWWARLATWAPNPNPSLPRCRYCGTLPLTRRDYCPCCGQPS